MDLWLIRLEPIIRLTCFVSFFSLLAIWQYFKNNRLVLAPLSTRWRRHASLWVTCLTCSGALFCSLMPIQIAVQVMQSKIGLFQFSSLAFLPYGVQVCLAILMLDWAVYFQHRAFHRISLAWRFHKIHHTDKEVELSTGMRFHPLESIVTLAVKIVAVIFIGPPILAVLLFEILLNGATLWTHANVIMPKKIETWLRYVFVTPDMHRIHHSDLPSEHHCNFGFIFSVWDKLFSTYKAHPQLGAKYLNMGLTEYQDPQYQRLKIMLCMPFKRYKKKLGSSLKPHMEAPA